MSEDKGRRIYTRIVIDMTQDDLPTIESDSFIYDGPMSLCVDGRGDSSNNNGRGDSESGNGSSGRGGSSNSGGSERGGSSNSGGSERGDFGGMSYGGGFGLSSVAGNTAAGVGGAGFGGSSKSGKDGGGSVDKTGLNMVQSKQTVEQAQAALAARVRDNAYATNLAYGLTTLGFLGVPGMQIAASLVRNARDYGRGQADLTSMERAAAANGMGEGQRGGDGGDGVSGGLGGISKPIAKPQTPAPTRTIAAAATGNPGSGNTGATVILGAVRSAAGSGARSVSTSSVRGFGVGGGLKI